MEELKESTIFITGGTGLIGSNIVKAILKMNKDKQAHNKIVLLVKDIKKAKKLFENLNDIEYIEGNILEYSPSKIKIDYIIHGASPTKSKYFINNPVETMDVAILGSKNILEQARISKVKSMVYLSSMEAYGTLKNNDTTEEQLGYIDISCVRSSYSEGKRVCELYCKSYCEEYELPIKIARLAQTFGGEISLDETRVYKYFCDCIINHEDIILKSNGKTKVNFCNINDCVNAIFKILLCGNNGETYNVVADKTNMTIYDIAKWLTDEYGEEKQKIVIDVPKEANEFAPENEMILSNNKLKALGWKPQHTLKETYAELLAYLRKEYEKK